MHSDELQNQLEWKLGFQGTAYVVMEGAREDKVVDTPLTYSESVPVIRTQMSCSHTTAAEIRAKYTPDGSHRCIIH